MEEIRKVNKRDHKAEGWDRLRQIVEEERRRIIRRRNAKIMAAMKKRYGSSNDNGEDREDVDKMDDDQYYDEYDDLDGGDDDDRYAESNRPASDNETVSDVQPTSEDGEEHQDPMEVDEGDKDMASGKRPLPSEMAEQSGKCLKQIQCLSRRQILPINFGRELVLRPYGRFHQPTFDFVRKLLLDESNAANRMLRVFLKAFTLPSAQPRTIAQYRCAVRGSFLDHTDQILLEKEIVYSELDLPILDLLQAACLFLPLNYAEIELLSSITRIPKKKIIPWFRRKVFLLLPMKIVSRKLAMIRNHCAMDDGMDIG